MYLHIGLDLMLDAKKIIGIFDIDLFKADEKEKISLKKKYSSFILTDTKIYFSEISAITLKRRMENQYN